MKMLLDDLRSFSRDPSGYPNSAATTLCKEAADRLESLSQALREAEAERDEWKQAAQVEAGLRREFLARAEAAESGLAEAMRVIEPFAEIGANLFVSLEDSQKNTMHWAVPTVGQFRAARAFIAGNGGKDG